jgi:hypothetical protein
MDVDYPAAHSMDTTWFAVDADGHVGHFQSGHSGASPTAAATAESDHLWSRLVLLQRPRCEARYDRNGELLPGPYGSGRGHRYGQSGTGTADLLALVFLDSLDPVKESISAGDAFPVPAHPGLAVVFLRLSDALTRQLHEAGHCRGCFYFSRWDLPSDAEDDAPSPAKLGMYQYEHSYGNCIAEPYGRRLVPSCPLHIDELPPDLRTLVGRFQFTTLRFAETCVIQPCEIGEVSCAEPAYLTSDGLTAKPILRNRVRTDRTYEEFYNEVVRSKSGWLKQIRVEPPAGKPPHVDEGA